jgi:hypothetical protein
MQKFKRFVSGEEEEPEQQYLREFNEACTLSYKSVRCGAATCGAPAPYGPVVSPHVPHCLTAHRRCRPQRMIGFGICFVGGWIITFMVRSRALTRTGRCRACRHQFEPPTRRRAQSCLALVNITHHPEQFALLFTFGNVASLMRCAPRRRAPRCMPRCARAVRQRSRAHAAPCSSGARASRSRPCSRRSGSSLPSSTSAPWFSRSCWRSRCAPARSAEGPEPSVQVQMVLPVLASLLVQFLAMAYYCLTYIPYGQQMLTKCLTSCV